MSSPSENVATARRYLSALERGTVGDDLAGFFTPDATQEEYPNRLLPHGAKRDLAAILDGAAKGRRVLSSQTFEVQTELAAGDGVALEVQWTGTLAVAIGTLPAGEAMRARFGVFLDFRDGRIARQRNYDCFEPW
jgi:ketosteroid isomerase-like protein